MPNLGLRRDMPGPTVLEPAIWEDPSPLSPVVGDMSRDSLVGCGGDWPRFG